MRRAYRARPGVVKQDGQAVGGADDQKQPRRVAHRRVGLLLEPAWASGEHAVAVYLMKSADVFSRDTKSFKDAPPVLRHRSLVVAAREPQVQTLVRRFADAARTRRKAVGHADIWGADKLQGHESSSANQTNRAIKTN